MRLSTSLRPECGIVNYFPTSIGYNRRLKKQSEQIIAAEKAAKVQKAKIAEGKRLLGSLRSDLWWDELTIGQKKYAETLCATRGYKEATTFIKDQGMSNRSRYRKSYMGIY